MEDRLLALHAGDLPRPLTYDSSIKIWLLRQSDKAIASDSWSAYL
jgi:hypothetical protein